MKLDPVGTERRNGVPCVVLTQAQFDALQAEYTEMWNALRRAAPWLGKLIADGGHKAATLPGDALRTLDMVERALAKAETP